MATIIHESELVRRAIEYIDQRLREEPNATKSALLDETAMRFNLGPLDAEALERVWRERFAAR